MKKWVCILGLILLCPTILWGCSQAVGEVKETIENEVNQKVLSMEEKALQKSIEYRKGIGDASAEKKLRVALEKAENYSLANSVIPVLPPEERGSGRWEDETYLKFECEILNTADFGDNSPIIKARQTDDEGNTTLTFIDRKNKVLCGKKLKAGDKLIVHAAQYQNKPELEIYEENDWVLIMIEYSDDTTGEGFTTVDSHSLIVELATKIE